MLGLGVNLNKAITSLPRKTTFNKYKMKTTRAGLSGNPTQRYSFTTGDTFTNNTLVTHGDSFFIGGDTATYEFDFGVKVAGSVVECPMRVFRINNSTIQAPTGTWVEWGSADQSTIDTYKTIGGASSGTNSAVNGNIAQIMVELDLTPLCNTMFGGSNATLKSALKAINVDAWAQGSGANASVLTNGCKMQIWNGLSTVWALMKSGTLATIEKLTGSAMSSDYITTANKVFILLNSTYPSNGTILGAMQLDYINIKIDLARVPDTVTPINVNLPKYWAMVVKGWSPSFDNLVSTTGLQYIASLYKDTNNFIQLYYNEVSDKFHLEKKIGGASTVVMFGGVETFLKFQSYSFVFGQSTAGMFLNILKNNNIAYYYKNVDTQTTNSIFNFYPQRWNTTYYANSFAESFHLLDLERMGKSAGFSDAETTAILNGTDLKFANPNLLDVNKVTLHANATRSNGVITLNATASTQISKIIIPVLPNNRYELNCVHNGNVYADYKYNNSLLGFTTSVISNTPLIFTPPNNCNNLVVMFYSTTAGTFTFSNISLKRKD